MYAVLPTLEFIVSDKTTSKNPYWTSLDVPIRMRADIPPPAGHETIN